MIGGYVQDVTVAHNEICYVPYSAVSLGWGWGTTDVSIGPKRETPWKEPSVCMRNHVMYNHLHHCMQELKYLPEYEYIKVKDGEVIRPAKTDLLVKHLFLMCGGLSYNLNSEILNLFILFFHRREQKQNIQLIPIGMMESWLIMLLIFLFMQA